MLLKLSLKNVRKSFKNYAVYFLTLVLGVAIFYVFNAMSDQAIMNALLGQDSTEVKKSLIDLMRQFLSFLSIFVSIILGFLVIYANRFLMKRRGKEFAIYLTLGMSKRKISQILSVETFLIGILSLGFGIVLGMILAQAMSAFVLQLFMADLSQFAFQISGAALAKTCLYFLVIFLIVAFFSIFAIRRAKLIDLLHLKVKREKNWLKKTWLVAPIFVISIICLVFAYKGALDAVAIENLTDTAELFGSIGRAIILGVVGTVLFFLSFANIILRIITLNKKFYFKKLRMFVARKFSQKISTMVASLSVISLMLFVTICLLASALSIKNFSEGNLRKALPYDAQISDNAGAGKDDINQFAKYFSESAKFKIFYTSELTWRDYFGAKAEEITEKYPFLRLDSVLQITNESDYNAVAKITGHDSVELNDDQFALNLPAEQLQPIFNEFLASGEAVRFAGAELSPLHKKVESGVLALRDTMASEATLIIPDTLAKKAEKETKYLSVQANLIGNLLGESRAEKMAVVAKIKDAIAADPEIFQGKSYEKFTLDDKFEIIDSMTGLSVIAVVIALYVGLVFLLASVAILAIKSLSDSLDSRENYQILRQIGASGQMLRRTLFFETAILFLLPLVVGLVHAAFGLQFSAKFLEIVGLKGDLVSSMIATVAIFAVIYGSYILMTYFYAKRIIFEKTPAPRD